MPKFDMAQALTHCVSVYVPSTRNGNEAIDPRPFVEDTIARLSRIFGGATAYAAEGGWVSDTLGLIVESVVIVKSYANVLDDETLDKVYAIAETLKRDLHQEAVSVEVDNALYFV